VLGEEGAAEEDVAARREALLEARDDGVLVGVGFEGGEQVGLAAVAAQRGLGGDGILQSIMR